MPEIDLFEGLDRMFRHQRVPDHLDPPAPFIMHRFLASDRDYALVAKELQKEVRDADFIFEIWRAAVPKAKGAPYFRYVAPGKPSSPDALVQRVMDVYAYNRDQAERAVSLVQGAGREEELALHLGVDPDDIGSSQGSD